MNAVMTRRHIVAAVGALVLMISIPPAWAAEGSVKIDNFTFTPPELTVAAGTAVTFTNRDDIPHSIAAADGSFHSRALDTEDAFTMTFAKPGTYDYYCALHPHMKGRIIVAP